MPSHVVELPCRQAGIELPTRIYYDISSCGLRTPCSCATESRAEQAIGSHDYEDDAKTVRTPAVEPVTHEVRSGGMHAPPTEPKKAKERAEILIPRSQACHRNVARLLAQRGRDYGW